MLPLLAIGGVIGAVMSVAKGASWLSDQLGSANGAASAGGKATPPAATASKSQFDAALSAQVAGQAVPVQPGTPTAVLPPQHGPDYDTLARLRVGVAAYSHVGEHRGNHPKPPQGAGDDVAVARA